MSPLPCTHSLLRSLSLTHTLPKSSHKSEGVWSTTPGRGSREGLGDLLAANFSSRLDMALEFAKPKRQHMLASWEDGKHK